MDKFFTSHNIKDKDLFMLFVQYRGRWTDEYVQELHKINTPYHIVMSIRKLRTLIPFLKSPVEKMMKRIITHPQCQLWYIDKTKRQLTAMSIFRTCIQRTCKDAHGRIWCQNEHDRHYYCWLHNQIGKTALDTRSIVPDELHLSINTKDEYKSITMNINFFKYVRSSFYIIKWNFLSFCLSVCLYEPKYVEK